MPATEAARSHRGSSSGSSRARESASPCQSESSKSMGGRIWVESEGLGKGSVFLPLADNPHRHHWLVRIDIEIDVDHILTTTKTHTPRVQLRLCLRRAI